MNVNQIRELVKLVEESDVSEIVVEEGDSRIVVRRGGTSSTESSSAPLQHAHAPAPVMPSSPESPQVTDAPGLLDVAHSTWKPVVAPMVGTFYSAASPGSAPFVAVGDTVAEGQALCILEAMKLMNEITADEAGIIREIPVTNGQPVEYGTVLFYYEPVA